MTQVPQASQFSDNWTGQQIKATYLDVPTPTPTTGVANGLDLGQNWEMIQSEDATPSSTEQSPRLGPRNVQFLSRAVTILPETPRQNTRRSSEGGSRATDLQFVNIDPLQCRMGLAPRRRGAFQDRERQEETGRTRQLKACVRCQMQKIRCRPDPANPTGTCLTCKEVSKPTLHSLECRRWRLTECTLYRTGKGPGLEFTFRWPEMKLQDIKDWASRDVRTIEVMSDVCPVPLKLHVRKFKPIPGKDATHKSWMDRKAGIRKHKPTTPYAIVNMKNAVHDMHEYISKNAFMSMEHVLRGSDQWVRETYAFARQYCYRVESQEERNLLKNFFRLWFAIRRTATTEHIAGEDTLDMKPETEDESFPLFGKVPLPPVMIQQLDMVLTLGVLDPLRKKVLEDFQKLAQTANPTNWMTVYLVTFMLLHSCALITDENYRNARKHGLRRRYSMPNFISDHHQGANVILHHYHYRTESCNPFKQDWTQRHKTAFSNMSPEDIMFLERTKTLLKAREEEIKTCKATSLYEHELYFVAQMFEEGWSPRDTAMDFSDDSDEGVIKKYAGELEGSK
ncbi:hypothetical protein VTJ49DRAFT_525 [Mycothermus thermophilus]|uniref:Zn(2)-C6 fungal-type domain-containing protein n=1 Tax=Humicola insolens TaxID=85995 RepID=A0ABR3VEW8_HUMIN